MAKNEKTGTARRARRFAGRLGPLGAAAVGGALAGVAGALMVAAGMNANAAAGIQAALGAGMNNLSVSLTMKAVDKITGSSSDGQAAKGASRNAPAFEAARNAALNPPTANELPAATAPAQPQQQPAQDPPWAIRPGARAA
jgi:hypothetical protein